jgi:hypothetical protein
LKEITLKTGNRWKNNNGMNIRQMGSEKRYLNWLRICHNEVCYCNRLLSFIPS